MTNSSLLTVMTVIFFIFLRYYLTTPTFTDVSSFGEEASSMEEEVPASERDEVYQRLQDALIHYDPPDILGRGRI